MRSELDAHNHRSPVVLVLAMMVAVITCCLAAWRLQPPPVKAGSVPNSEFSATRAQPILEMLVGDAIPHPAGSKDLMRVRGRIIEYIEQLGYTVERQHWQAARGRGVESVGLVNLIVQVQGEQPTGKVMLAAHYDSAPTSLGAADDGVGVAVLLAYARHLAETNPPRNDVVFLLTDGEELGTRGAKRFVNFHPLASEIDVAVNLEARGTSGPSLMFETGKQSLWAIKIFSSVSPKPFTSSLFYEIYRHLPNDTDFSRFRRVGMEGFNLAFIRDVKHYHTLNDSLANLSRASFQHQGDNTYALMNYLTQTDLCDRSTGRAVYFDWLGYKVFYWPQSWSIWMAVFLAIATMAAGISALRFRSVWWKQGGLLLTFFIGEVLLVAALILLNWALKFDGQLDSPWPAHPWVIMTSFWSSAICLVSAWVWLWSHTTDSSNLASLYWVGNALVWCSIGVIVAIFGPAACYVFIVPLAFCVLGVFLRGRLSSFFHLAPWIGVAVLWIPMEFLFYDAVGYTMNALLIIRVTLVISAAFSCVAIAGKSAAGWTATAAGVVATASLTLGHFQ